MLNPEIGYEVIPIDELDEEDLQSLKLNWPAEKDQIWRHITNVSFYVNSKRYEYTSLLAVNGQNGPHKSFYLTGNLIPYESIGDLVGPMILVKIDNYSIDLGTSQFDESRGLWMQSGNTYYKVIGLSTEYEKAFGRKDVEKVQKFGELYDALVYSEPPFCHAGTTKFKCMQSITEIKKISANWFDLEFVYHCKELVLDHLKSIMNIRRSGVFLQSIANLTGKMPRPIACFM